MTMSIVPVDRSCLTKEVALTLESMILSDEYAPGDRLPPIRDLARDLKVGLTTVREALRRLESLSLIRIAHGSGIFVTNQVDRPILVRPLLISGRLEPEVLADLIAVRQMLETGSAELAASAAPAEGIERLHDVFCRMEETLDDSRAFSEEDTRFHLHLAEISGNAVLHTMLEALSEMIVKHQERMHEEPAIRHLSLAFHRRILTAIEDRSPNEARMAMAEHLHMVQETLKRQAQVPQGR